MFLVVYQVAQGASVLIQRDKQTASAAIGLRFKHFDPGQQNLFLMKEDYYEI